MMVFLSKVGCLLAKLELSEYSTHCDKIAWDICMHASSAVYSMGVLTTAINLVFLGLRVFSKTLLSPSRPFK